MPIVNHEEATELAEMQQETSNLARCYLAARKELAELRVKAEVPADVIVARVNVAMPATSDDAGAAKSWECPIGMADCYRNCGNYGCGN